MIIFFLHQRLLGFFAVHCSFFFIFVPTVVFHENLRKKCWRKLREKYFGARNAVVVPELDAAMMLLNF
jgi:hypothetical protein